MSVNRLTLPVGLRPKVGAVVALGTGSFLFFLLHLLVDALQDDNSTPNGPDIAITIKMAMVGIFAK